MLTLLALALTANLSTGARADSNWTLNGVSMPETVTIGNTSLVLNGMALRKKAIFKVYVAGLYLPERTTSASAILDADQPRRIVLHFVRNVDKGKMCGAWRESLENNTPNASAELRAQFETLCGYMEDIEKQQQFVFTYLPGEGTTVEVKGEAKGTIEAKDFADALFKSWLGPKPGPGEDFKKHLLGQAN